MYCVWDQDFSPDYDEKINFIFWNNPFDVKNRSLCLVDLLEENADKFKSEFLHYIFRLGKAKLNNKSIIEILTFSANFSFWWMTPIAEKSNWAKSPQINNILKLMAFKNWLDSNECSELLINTNNQNLLSSFEQLCKSKGIKLTNINKKSYLISFASFEFGMKIFIFFQSIIWLIREVLISLIFSFQKNNFSMNSKPEVTFISYLARKDVFQRGESLKNNFYWGNLPEYLENKKIPSNWIYLPNRNISLIKTLIFFRNQKKGFAETNHVSILSFFRMKLLISIFKNYLTIFKKSDLVLNVLEKESFYLWPLMKEDSIKSFYGIGIIKNLFYFSLFEQASKTSPKFKNLIYLYENQPWELAAVNFFRNKAENVIGFAHSTIRYWDLRYFSDPLLYVNEEENSLPSFRKLVVHSEIDKKNLLNSGFPEEKLEFAESLRYLYLNDYLSRNYRKEKVKTLLVLGDYLQSDTNFLLSLVNSPEAKNILKTLKIIIKPHPSNKIKRLNFDDLKINLDDSDIGKLIYKSDIVFTGNVSSSAAEAYALNKKIICARNFAQLNMSPLRGLKEVSFVYDSESFAKALEEKLSSNNIITNQIFFNLNDNLALWKGILKI